MPAWTREGDDHGVPLDKSSGLVVQRFVQGGRLVDGVGIDVREDTGVAGEVARGLGGSMSVGLADVREAGSHGL